MAMIEHERALNPAEVTNKWEKILKSGHEFPDSDLFNLGQDVLKARSRKWPARAEVELISTSGKVVLAYFPENPEMPESLWIEINQEGRPVSYDIQKQNNGFRTFLLKEPKKGDPRLIFLTRETRLEIAQMILGGHKFTSQKRRTVPV